MSRKPKRNWTSPRRGRSRSWQAMLGCSWDFKSRPKMGFDSQVSIQGRGGGRLGLQRESQAATAIVFGLELCNQDLCDCGSCCLRGIYLEPKEDLAVGRNGPIPNPKRKILRTEFIAEGATSRCLGPREAVCAGHVVEEVLCFSASSCCAAKRPVGPRNYPSSHICTANAPGPYER